MPLTAELGAELIDATAISDDRWAAVHRVRPRPDLHCRGCGSAMHAKVSPRALRFFAHDAAESTCPHAGETPAHRALKGVLATLARRAGWEAALEVAAPSGAWRADVLALDPDRGLRVALEAQLASMTPTEGRERTDRYQVDGVGVLWVTTKETPWLYCVPSVRLAPDADLSDPDALTVLSGLAKLDDSGWLWNPPPTPPPLARIVAGVLDGRIIEHRCSSFTEVRRGHGRWFSDAIVLVKASELAVHGNTVSRAEADERNHRTQLNALYGRQQYLIPTAYRDAECTIGEVTWIGVPAVRPAHPHEPTLKELSGNDKTAQGAPVWVGSHARNLRLVSIVAPVASRIEASLAASWHRRGVGVYAADAHEAARLARALSWRVSDIVVPPGEPPSFDEFVRRGIAARTRLERAGGGGSDLNPIWARHR